MPINSISTNPVSPVSIKGTGSVERPPAVPEASLLQPLPSVIATNANPEEKLRTSPRQLAYKTKYCNNSEDKLGNHYAYRFYLN